MQRLFLPMLLEATRTLQESLITSSGIIDIALRKGLGMTGSSAGLFGWANGIGATTIVEWLRPLQSLGKRFEPSEFRDLKQRFFHVAGIIEKDADFAVTF